MKPKRMLISPSSLLARGTVLFKRTQDGIEKLIGESNATDSAKLESLVWNCLWQEKLVVRSADKHLTYVYPAYEVILSSRESKHLDSAKRIILAKHAEENLQARIQTQKFLLMAPPGRQPTVGIMPDGTAPMVFAVLRPLNLSNDIENEQTHKERLKILWREDPHQEEPWAVAVWRESSLVGEKFMRLTTCVVGRQGSSTRKPDVGFPCSDHVSGRHITITREMNDGQFLFYVRDGAKDKDGTWRHSTHGTLLNGRALAANEKVPLQKEDILYLGHYGDSTPGLVLEFRPHHNN